MNRILPAGVFYFPGMSRKIGVTNSITVEVFSLDGGGTVTVKHMDDGGRDIQYPDDREISIVTNPRGDCIVTFPKKA